MSALDKLEFAIVLGRELSDISRAPSADKVWSAYSAALLARRLMSAAKSYHRLAEAACNGADVETAMARAEKRVVRLLDGTGRPGAAMSAACLDCLGSGTTVGQRLGTGREYASACERCGGTGKEPTCSHCGAALTDEERRAGGRECFACESRCSVCLSADVVALVAGETVCEKCLSEARRKVA